MKRIGMVRFYHETNSFALEQNNEPDAKILKGEKLIKESHPKNYIGGFVEGTKRSDVELVPILGVDFEHGGLIHAQVFEHYRDRILKGIKDAQPLDGLYFSLHGAMAVQEPYTGAEANLIRTVRQMVGDDIPFVGTYDFHGIYTDWEVKALIPFPLNTNPHIDGFERGKEAAQCLIRTLNGDLNPVTSRVFVPIIGPNIGQSTWSHNPAEEISLPLYQLNRLRKELEEKSGVINVTMQGGYGYADTPDTGMCVIATTDDNVELADQIAKELAKELWERREEILNVRRIVPIDKGIELAMACRENPVCLVDLGDDPGSACPADSPAVLEGLIRLGACDCALTIRDPEALKVGLEAGVGTALDIEIGGKIDQRFYKPLPVKAKVKSIDDGHYKIVGPTHGGWGREVTKEAFREENVGPRVVLRIGDKIDVIVTEKTTGKDRDFFKSAGIVLDEKQIIVVKSNQAHRASFDPVVSATINLNTPGTSTVNYKILPYKRLTRPIYPLDEDMEWQPP